MVGIGININQTNFDKGLGNAVSLKQITGKTFDVVMLAKELQGMVLERAALASEGEFDNLLDEYNSRLFKKDSTVKLRKGEIEFNTVIKYVLPNGQLFTTDIIDNFFDFGEIEWVL